METIDRYSQDRITNTKNYDLAGGYRLVIETFSQGEGYWSYTKGTLFDKEGRVLVECPRNYSAFPYKLIQQDGKFYFVCSRDYHGGYSVFDLETGQEYCYQPDHSEPLKQYWCWAEIDYDEEKKQLLVEGCYWACPFEEHVYDFSDPTIIPLPFVSERYLEYDDDEEEDEE